MKQVMDELIVHECFLSLQGESSFAGFLCFFVRLAGCNLRCAYCDTVPAQDEAAGRAMTIPEIVRQAQESGCRLVEITGGEPMCRPGAILLMRELLAAGFTVLLETNGSIPLNDVPPEVHRIIDYKLPDSGMCDAMCDDNFRNAGEHDEIKFVISGRGDYEYARDVVAEYKLGERKCQIIYSPVWGKVAFADLAAWLVADRMPGRMQIQMHKIIWGAEKTGV